MTRNSLSRFVHSNGDAVVRCYDLVQFVLFGFVRFGLIQVSLFRSISCFSRFCCSLIEQRENLREAATFVSSPLRLPSSSFSFSSSYPSIKDVLVLHSLDHHGHVTFVPFVWAARGERERGRRKQRRMKHEATHLFVFFFFTSASERDQQVVSDTVCSIVASERNVFEPPLRVSFLLGTCFPYLNICTDNFAPHSAFAWYTLL